MAKKPIQKGKFKNATLHKGYKKRTVYKAVDQYEREFKHSFASELVDISVDIINKAEDMMKANDKKQ